MSQKTASIVMFISDLESIPGTLIVTMEYGICDIPDETVDKMSELANEWSTYTMNMPDFLATVWYPSKYDLDDILFMLGEMLTEKTDIRTSPYWLN